MIYRLAADAALLMHAAFILFVVFGGMLVWRWPRAAWAHLPAAIWGALAELAGTGCPLTGLENELLAKGGLAGYSDGFIEHYLLGAIYPSGLTRSVEMVLGAAVIAINAVVYAIAVRSYRRRGRRAGAK